MINDNIAQFKTLREIIHQYENPIKRFENIIQAWDGNLYHYFIENTQGWKELPMTSINPEFFNNEEN